MIKTVLFDVFGTLIDDHTDQYCSPFSHLLAALDLDRQQIVSARRLLMTSRLTTIDAATDRLEQLYTGGSIPAHVRETAASELEQHMASYSFVAGAEKCLKVLRDNGLRLALVTNLAAPYEQVIDRLGLGRLVDTTICSFDVGFQKPDREIYETALSRLQVSTADTIMVGDDEVNDVAGAQAVGIRSILVSSGAEDGGASLRRATERILSEVRSDQSGR